MSDGPTSGAPSIEDHSLAQTLVISKSRRPRPWLPWVAGGASLAAILLSGGTGCDCSNPPHQGLGWVYAWMAIGAGLGTALYLMGRRDTSLSLRLFLLLPILAGLEASIMMVVWHLCERYDY